MGSLYRPSIRWTQEEVSTAARRLGLDDRARDLLTRRIARGESWARLATTTGADAATLRAEFAGAEAALRGALPPRRESPTIWMKYYQDGRAVCESTNTTSREEARKVLRQREGDVSKGLPVSPAAEKVTVATLLADVKNDYTNNGRRSLERLGFSLARLTPAFGARAAHKVTGADIKAYAAQRLSEGAAPATVNRELAALRRAFRLGLHGDRIHRMPHVTLLKEAAPRAGFFERDQYDAVCRHLPEPLRPVVRFAYVTGWRMQAEILPLGWRAVDFKAGTVRLEPGTTKNSEGRMFVMTPELRALLEAQRAATDELQRKLGAIIPFVFHRRGRPIKNLRGAWKIACTAAGVPGRIPHDFRRTAVRNLERAGVSRSVAMKMTGHKTEAVYRRYAIVSDADLHEAARKLAALEPGRPAAMGNPEGNPGRAAAGMRRGTI